MSLCSNDMKYSHNTRNIAQNFMFADIKGKKNKSWALNLELSYPVMLDAEAGASKVFPTHSAAGWAFLTLFVGYAAHEAALMTQFSHFSDHSSLH